MSFFLKICIVLIACFPLKPANAQPSLLFKKITVDQGLNDAAVQAIARDKMGYMWFSTIGGLNRYDGSSIKYFNQVYGPKGTVLLSICRSILSDSAGRLFFAFENGLAEFDFATQTMHMVPAIGDAWVYDMYAISDSVNILFTNEGIIRYNTNTQEVFKFRDQSRHKIMRQIRPYGWTAKDHRLYLSYADGLYDYDVDTDSLYKIPMPEVAKTGPVNYVSIDGNNVLWLGLINQHLVVRLNPVTADFKAYPNLIPGGELGLSGLYTHPANNQVWVATSSYGLLQYIAEEDRFIRHQNIPLQSWTPNSNLVRTMFLDDDGSVWLGGDYGINYANPSQALFEIIPPFNTDITNRNRQMARVVSEDADGNLWFGTLDGLVKYNPAQNTYHEYNNRQGKPNKIHHNSVRGVLATNDGYVWVATGRGINRLNTHTQKIDFFDLKDSVSTGFYFSINKDNLGYIWFCGRDGEGLYYFNPRDKKFHGIARHPALKVFSGNGFRYLLHDSKGRYWFAFNGQGLGMYNPANGQVEKWSGVPGKNGAISGNYLVDIKEDKTGKIWVSTYNGLTCIDPVTNAISNFTTRNGLVSNTTAALAVDSLNRLWIGTARGLMMLDSDRKYFTSFNMNSWLPNASFPEHAAYVTKNGDFIMATTQGYIRFNPLRYKPADAKIRCYINEVSVLDRNMPILPSEGEVLNLKYFQNAIALKLVGINYDNPTQTWFAYKLEGFDKEWHYTQDPKVVYNNLKGGNYRFLYKAGSNAYLWNIPEKEWRFEIGTVFYKTTWFWMLMVVLITGFLFWMYKLRMANLQQLYNLQNRTQQLEKEKAMVMYENLKQHLNPHFLFNSLTSLSSLIRIDQGMAGDFLDRMSKIYRYILKNRDSEKVALKDEIEFVQHFIDLQKTRFEEALEVYIDMDEEYLHRRIVPVTLQNLVENAIKHNTISKLKPLVIRITCNDEYLLVSNNLQKKNFVETSNQQGIQRMRNLYQYLVSTPLLVEENNETFTVKIPLL